MPRVCIDPGHGGYDPGAIGNGLKEKDLTLSTGLFLRDMLLQDGRFQVVMTRDGDYAPGHLENQLNAELTYRSDVANNFKAELFIAIHFNASGVGGHGVESLDYNGQGCGHTFAQTLCDIITAEEGLKNRGVKPTNKTFSVIRASLCDAVITEAAFIDCAADILHFDTPEELKKLAWYHYRAICAAFGLKLNYELDPCKKGGVKVELKPEAIAAVMETNSKLWYVANADCQKVYEYINQCLKQVGGISNVQ